MSLRSFVEIVKRDALGRPVLGPDGRPIKGIGVNPIKPHVRSYWLLPHVASQDVTGTLEFELEFLIDQQGHFDWASIMGVIPNPVYVDFFDASTQRKLQNRPVHSSLIVGSAVRKFNLPEPYFFNVGDSQRSLIVKVRNVATQAQNVIRLVLHGRRIYHKEAPADVALDIQREFSGGWRTYSYFLVPNEYDSTGAPTAVGALGTATFTFESDASADTEIHKLMVNSTGAFTFTLRERATNRLLMSDVVENTSGWGNAEFPLYLPDTYLLERQKELLMDVTDLSNAENTIHLCMAGRRLQLIP